MAALRKRPYPASGHYLSTACGLASSDLILPAFAISKLPSHSRHVGTNMAPLSAEQPSITKPPSRPSPPTGNRRPTVKLPAPTERANRRGDQENSPWRRHGRRGATRTCRRRRPPGRRRRCAGTSTASPRRALPSRRAATRRTPARAAPKLPLREIRRSSAGSATSRPSPR
jgi:hypothetical protein